MKKYSLNLTLLIVAITMGVSCSDKYSNENIAKIMFGHLLYTYKIISYQNKDGKIVYAKDEPKLQDDRFRFKIGADGKPIAIRYQGDLIYFPGTPKSQLFTFSMKDGKITSADMGGNTVIFDGRDDHLTIVEIPNPTNPNEEFKAYDCLAVPDGDGTPEF